MLDALMILTVSGKYEIEIEKGVVWRRGEIMLQNSFALTILLSLLSLSAVLADDSGKPALWKVSKTSEKESSMFNASSWPQLKMPTFPTFEGAKSRTGQAFRTTRNTASRWWHNTIDFLTPWDNEDSSKTKSKGGAWLFQKKEEPKEIHTVNDFLRLERPKF